MNQGSVASSSSVTRRVLSEIYVEFQTHIRAIRVPMCHRIRPPFTHQHIHSYSKTLILTAFFSMTFKILMKTLRVTELLDATMCASVK